MSCHCLVKNPQLCSRGEEEQETERLCCLSRRCDGRAVRRGRILIPEQRAAEYLALDSAPVPALWRRALAPRRGQAGMKTAKLCRVCGEKKKKDLPKPFQELTWFKMRLQHSWRQQYGVRDFLLGGAV